MTGRRNPRCGRHLSPQEAAPLLDASPVARDLHDSLAAQGFTLHPTVRPYRRADGLITIRFVWRQRDDGGCVEVSHTDRFAFVGENP